MMIVCQVCHTENNHLAITCKTCRGFLQARIENLDLFRVAWNVIERPRRAFHLVAVAQHKNYSLLLASIAGMAFVFFFFWVIKAGEYSESLINILAAGAVTGPPIGLVVVLLYATCSKVVSRFSGVGVSLWQLYAVASYSLVPVVISAILVLPIELMTFGIFFFTKNPSPYLLKPVSYGVMLALDGAFGMWSLCLLTIGMRTLFDERWPTTFLRVLVSLGIVVGAVVAVVWHFGP